ncbi:tetratricopeptide repeat protein [Reticulibacter mediterranei]|nr:tetratricopeptide repeat protein [Reticulibacter mediterranei]
MSGLGGVGKTQLALEYAYQYRSNYQVVFWAQADTYEALLSSFVIIASLLRLSERETYNHPVAVQAVKEWLQTHSGWLLILDNADDLAMIREFLPPIFEGHLLLTTRTHAMGRLGQRIEVDTLSPEMGALFLLRRAAIIPPDMSWEQVKISDRESALELTQELGGLPLALDQAGAYIEEAGCNISDYQQLYQQYRVVLLKERRGIIPDHPESVATTWLLSFERVEQVNPAASELLRLCAFLAPDSIPEEMITEGSQYLGPRLAAVAADAFLFNQAIGTLLAYSLIHRDANHHVLSIHRLVQAVLKDAMNKELLHIWAERTVWVVAVTFPREDHTRYSRCEQYLPHVRECIRLIELENIVFLEAAQLLDQAAHYLQQRTRYWEREPLYQQALRIREQLLGSTHQDTVQSMINLAWAYSLQEKYILAEPLWRQILTIREQQLGIMHPLTVQSMARLGSFCAGQGQDEEAELLYQHALTLREQIFGPTHPDTAEMLISLARLYRKQRKYERAEPLYERSLKIYEQLATSKTLSAAYYLGMSAQLYEEQGKYAQAEWLHLQELAIQERIWGPQHHCTAASLSSLAHFYHKQAQYEKAIPLFQRAVAIYEQTLGEVTYMASSLSGLAQIYRSQRKFEDAKSLYQQILAIDEQTFGPIHSHTAGSLSSLAQLYEEQEKNEKAVQLYQKAFSTYEKLLEAKHVSLRNISHGADQFHVRQDQPTDLLLLHQRLLAICEQALGLVHPSTAANLSRLAFFYHKQGKYEEAEAFYRRALATYAQMLGPRRPAELLKRYTSLLQAMGRKIDIKQLYAE